MNSDLKNEWDCGIRTIMNMNYDTYSKVCGYDNHKIFHSNKLFELISISNV